MRHNPQPQIKPQGAMKRIQVRVGSELGRHLRGQVGGQSQRWMVRFQMNVMLLESPTPLKTAKYPTKASVDLSGISSPANVPVSQPDKDMAVLVQPRSCAQRPASIRF